MSGGTDAAALGFEAIALGDGTLLAACIDADADVTFWIVKPLNDIEQHAAIHGRSSDARHDQLGPLPAAYRDRLRQVARSRCGRTCRGGRSCRNIVVHAGEPCSRHRSPAANDQAFVV